MKPTLLLLLCAALWSSGGMFIKLISLPAIATAGGRSFVAFLFLVAISRKFSWFKSRTETYLALAFSFTVILFVAATKEGPAANAIFLQSTAPLYVALFSAVYLKEKLRSYDGVALLLVFVGICFFFAEKMGGSNLMANFLGLSSGLGFAFYILISRKLSTEGIFRAVVWGNLFTFIFSLSAWRGLELHQQDIWALVLVGIFQLALPYWLYAKALPHVKALNASLIFLLEPLLNPVWVYLAIGERPSTSAMLGGALVLGAVLMKQLLDYRTQKKSPPQLPAVD